MQAHGSCSDWALAAALRAHEATHVGQGRLRGAEPAALRRSLAARARRPASKGQLSTTAAEPPGQVGPAAAAAAAATASFGPAGAESTVDAEGASRQIAADTQQVWARRGARGAPLPETLPWLARVEEAAGGLEALSGRAPGRPTALQPCEKVPQARRQASRQTDASTNAADGLACG